MRDASPGATDLREPPPLPEVRRIVLDALRGHDADVFLFGSWARGTPSRTSDIDVAILPRGALPREILSLLRERLEESHVPQRVEIVNLAEGSDALRERVLLEGRRWTGS
ncbi:MAG: nucleotidyltransferase domain-containing protein [Planctomycetes bacterium]|nr:nucleotidyltransferase domain-containing protein [Planctomycetota bacterium]